MKMFAAFFMLAMAALSSCGNVMAAALDHSCSPCLDRKQFKIHAFVPHEWGQVKASAIAAAQALNVNFTIQSYTQDPYNEAFRQMGFDIETEVQSDRPDALIIAVPNGNHDEVEQLAHFKLTNSRERRSIPILGLGGSKQASQAIKESLLFKDENINPPMAWVGTASDHAIGHMAAAKFGKARRITNALFLYSKAGNNGYWSLPDRLQGFKDGLALHANERGNVTGDSIQVQDLALEEDTMQGECPWDVIFWNHVHDVHLVLGWMNQHKCTNTLLGAMVEEESPQVQQQIRDGDLLFGISQQASLQGYLGVVLTTLYLTTGQLPPAIPAELEMLTVQDDDDILYSRQQGSSVFWTRPMLWDSSTLSSVTSNQDTTANHTTSGSLSSLRGTNDAISLEEDDEASSPRTIGFAIFDEDDPSVDPKYVETITMAAMAAAQDLDLRLLRLLPTTYSLSLPSEEAETWEKEYQDDDKIPRLKIDEDHNMEEVAEEDNSTTATVGTSSILGAAIHQPRTTLWDTCRHGTKLLDGLIVALPQLTHDFLLEDLRTVYMHPEHFYVAAIRRCIDQGIPVVALRGNFVEPSLNDIAEPTEQNPFGVHLPIQHHVRPNLFSAGYQAGREFVQQALANSTISKHNVWCFFTAASGNVCAGLRAAVEEAQDELAAGMSILSMEDFRSLGDRMSFFVDSIHETIRAYREQGHGIHFLFADTVLLPAVEEMIAREEGKAQQGPMIIGVMGVNEAVYSWIKKGKIHMALDPQWYSEGYLSVALLAHQGSLENWAIETKPSLVVDVPTDEQRDCQTNLFPVCPKEEEEDSLLSGKHGFDTSGGVSLEFPYFGALFQVATGILLLTLVA